MFELHSPAIVQAGWILSWITAVLLIVDGLFGVFGQRIAPEIQKRMFVDAGFTLEQALPMALTVTASAMLYAYPATSVLGAILITGYMGGAIATTYRVRQIPPTIISIVLGLMTWGGLFLRDPRISALLPIMQV